MNKYDIELDLTNRNSLSVLLKHIKKNSTVLEFGPANGRLTKYLKNELNCRVYAVEIDKEAASSIEQYCEVLVVGDIESYAWEESFKGIEFDTIIFADVLEHLYFPDKVLMESKKFLKEDGNILVSLPNIAHNAIIMELLSDKFSYSETGLLDNTHIRFFTNSSFLEMVERCGLFCSYESGIYARANETEFGYVYDDFEMGDVMQTREYGEVYQFLYALKKNSADEKISDFDAMYKKEKTLGIAKLYVDVGDGFCEEKSIEIKNPQTKKSLKFDVSGFEGIKNLRFDPFDSMLCLELHTISLLFDDESIKEIVPVRNNSCCAHSGVDYFLNDESHYLCIIDEETQSQVKKVVVTCDYKFIGEKVINAIENFLSLQALELSEIKDLSSLQALELSEIQNLSSLQALELSEIQNLSSLQALELSEIKNLSSLQALELSEIKDLSSLQALELSEIKNLSSLQALELSEMKDLSSLQALELSEIKDLSSLQALELSEIKGSKGWKFLTFVRKVKKVFSIHRYKKYLLPVKSNPRLIVLFAQDMFRHGIKSSIRKAKRKANEQKSDEQKGDLHKGFIKFEDILNKFDAHKEAQRVNFKGVIDILIPVYNGFEFLEPLFESIVKNSSLKYRLIVINDCSPDERVNVFLQKFVETHRNSIDIVFLQNEENLGFLKSVNKAVQKVKNHFVLLNTDTEVPPLWLERLMSPIIKNKNIATTTPMTNSGEICSFPKWLSDNEIYRGLDVALVDKYFSYVSFEKNSVSVPTGVGFCMGVNKNVYDKIGMFDEIFGKGYGEENDWCMRAIESGYKNIIVPNLFVYHKHGGSFLSSEKKAFIENNLKILWKKHPSYNALIQDLIEKNPLEDMRNFLEILITFNTSKKNILIIDHDLGGGTSIYRNERISQCLKNDEKIVLFSYNFFLNSFKISFYLSENELLCYACIDFDALQRLSDFIKIDEIFVNSIVSFGSSYSVLEKIRALKEKYGASLVLPIHDFNCVCPSYTLLNDKNSYCRAPQELDICNKCLDNHKGSFRTFESSRVEMDIWRQEWEKIINVSDLILCFSKSSANIIQNVYDVEGKVEIIPHKVEILSPVEIEQVAGNEINIAVIGGINLAKGSLILKDMIEIIEKSQLNINIIVIGELDLALHSQHLRVHGRYERDTLPELMSRYNIMACLIPSIWPETFSYTSEEIMMMGLPLFVFDLGAPAERVQNYSKGYVIDKIDAKSVLDAIGKVFGL